MAATRTKTIEYAFPMMVTDIGESTTHTDSADMTIYIPENSAGAPCSFVSCTLEVTCHDNHASVGTDLSAWSIRLSCDGGSNWTTVTRSNTVADSGENMSYLLVGDVTAELTARYGTGTSNATTRWGIYLDYASTTGTPTFTNVAAKLIITYAYDAATFTTTRIKTVRIPIESNTSRLSNTLTEIGTNQIPDLDDFLPEASKTYRQIFLELWTNNAPSATTDSVLSLAYDSDAAATFGNVEGTNQSPLIIRYLWDKTAAATNAAHALKAAHGNAGESHYNWLGGWLTVTYEFNASTSTSIINSVIVPLGSDNFQQPLTSTDKTRKQAKFMVEEPATVTLVQSAVCGMVGLASTSGTLSILAGSQTARDYTTNAQAGQAGGGLVVQRVDANGVQGAGMTLARGENTLTVDWYFNVTDPYVSMSAMAIINYTSGKASGGEETHNQSVYYLIADTNRNASTRWNLTPTAPAIIETSFYINAITEVAYFGTIANAAHTVTHDIELGAGEGMAAGWQQLYDATYIVGTGERCPWIIYGPVSGYLRYTGDPRAGVWNVETTRQHYFTSIYAMAQAGFGWWLTYHSITYAVSKSVTGYAGDGSAIAVKLYKSSNDEYVGTATTAAGGGYTFTWYDNATTIYATAREDSTHTGRSENFTAGA